MVPKSKKDVDRKLENIKKSCRKAIEKLQEIKNDDDLVMMLCSNHNKLNK